MPFEYAASWPREAEESLKWAKERAMRYLKLKDRVLLAGITIDSKAAREGYDWEIVTESSLQSVLAENAREAVLRKIPPDRANEKDWIAEFAALIALETNELEWNQGLNGDKQEIYELWDRGQVHPVQAISPELCPAFEEYLLAKRFL